MVNAKLRYQKIKELREILNGYPLQSPSTGGLDNETEIYICAMPGVCKSQNTAPEVLARYRRKLKARVEVANLFKPMCSTLECSRTDQGKETQPHHYTNESNMITRIVLGGLTAKQWAKMHGIEGEPRDAMTVDQLEHMSYLERTNITLLDMGMDYPQRKAELTRLSQRWMAKRLGNVASGSR